MCLRGLLLVAGLVLSSWALTPEECEPLVTPVSLADSSMIHGVTYFLAGYAKTNVSQALLRNCDSFWINVTESGPQNLVFAQFNKVNGSCTHSLFNVTVDVHTATGFFANITQSFHILPSSDHLIVVAINNTIRNSPIVNRRMKNIGEVPEEFINSSLFMLGRNATLSEVGPGTFGEAGELPRVLRRTTVPLQP
ncbi:hypothetical protein PBY51_005617 [Eleginops maclovinus]|uniref:Uncharacterized protein n=1 Tax=Eleginops maclovinus TaxID=56733 RepID=A0AAN7X9J9_ELEMC|nr:hypothetical protein PBY51_005617 [Eleginops maclovinus]